MLDWPADDGKIGARIPVESTEVLSTAHQGPEQLCSSAMTSSCGATMGGHATHQHKVSASPEVDSVSAPMGYRSTSGITPPLGQGAAIGRRFGQACHRTTDSPPWTSGSRVQVRCVTRSSSCHVLIGHAGQAPTGHYNSSGKPGRHDKQPGVTHAPVTAAMTTTHAPVMATMTTAADTDMAAEEQDNSSSEESGSSSQESSEEDVNIQSKTADLCVKHPELTEIESQCVAEYKAMKKAKCNSTSKYNTS
uniref:Uncharacterized protein n=1 Tax=Timema genevievae TaxID=629358 RepID=A0A7R9K2Q3_TIMGE|nr:unnamed protein product [Timema genevievae]